MQDKLQDILKTISHDTRGGAPREDWVKQNREILLMQVRNTTDQAAKPCLRETARLFVSLFVPVDALAMCGRVAGIFVLVSGSLMGGGLASAQVLKDAAPGDLTYGMKVAVERIQLALAPNDEYRTRLHADFADRRMDEVAKLAESSGDRQELASGAIRAFDGEVAELEIGLDALAEEQPHDLVEVAKLLERKMAVYQNVLRKTGPLLPLSVQYTVAVARNRVDAVSLKAMAVIVEKHIAGDQAAPKTVVVNKFEERLRQAETNLDSSTPRLLDPSTSIKVKVAIAEAKELIKGENYQAALTKIVEVAELTKESEASSASEDASGTSGTEPEPGTSSTTK